MRLDDIRLNTGIFFEIFDWIWIKWYLKHNFVSRIVPKYLNFQNMFNRMAFAINDRDPWRYLFVKQYPKSFFEINRLLPGDRVRIQVLHYLLKNIWYKLFR